MNDIIINRDNNSLIIMLLLSSYTKLMNTNKVINGCFYAPLIMLILALLMS